MFDEIADFISTVFTIAVIIIVASIVFAIIKAIVNYQKEAERREKEEKEKQELIDQIILDSKENSIEGLIYVRDTVLKSYNELYACKQSGSIKRKDFVLIWVGDDLGCYMDLETCYTVLQIINEEIKRRQR